MSKDVRYDVKGQSRQGKECGHKLLTLKRGPGEPASMPDLPGTGVQGPGDCG